jgi:hypothetical protein
VIWIGTYHKPQVFTKPRAGTFGKDTTQRLSAKTLTPRRKAAKKFHRKVEEVE